MRGQGEDSKAGEASGGASPRHLDLGLQPPGRGHGCPFKPPLWGLCTATHEGLSGSTAAGLGRKLTGASTGSIPKPRVRAPQGLEPAACRCRAVLRQSPCAGYACARLGLPPGSPSWGLRARAGPPPAAVSPPLLPALHRPPPRSCRVPALSRGLTFDPASSTQPRGTSGAGDHSVPPQTQLPREGPRTPYSSLAQGASDREAELEGGRPGLERQASVTSAGPQ